MLFVILLIPIMMFVLAFIKIIRSDNDTIKENNDRAKDEPQESEGNPNIVLSTVQGEQEIHEKIQGESIRDEENKTVTVTIDKIPYECRHTLCFDCEYCYCTKPYIKECARNTQKIVWNPTTNKGYCLNREENED